MKRCTKCGEQKELSEFHKTKRAKDGYRSWCKLCVCDDAKAKRLADPTRFRGYSKKCNDKNREKRRQYGRQWYEQNRERKLAKVKQQRREDPRHFRLLSAKCYLRNIEKRKAYAKRYRQANREKLSAYEKAWRARQLPIEFNTKDGDSNPFVMAEWQRRQEAIAQQEMARERVNELMQELTQPQREFLETLMEFDGDIKFMAKQTGMDLHYCQLTMTAIRTILKMHNHC